MRISINILPDQHRERMYQEKLIGSILSVGFSIIFNLLLLCLTMYGMIIILNLEYKSAKMSAENYFNSPSNEIDESEKFFKEVGNKVSNLKKIDSEVTHWSKILIEITRKTPSGIQITNLSIKEEHIKIDGIAKDRESYLEFQRNLNFEGFKNMVLPISNLVSPENLNFTIELDVEKEYLNKL